MKRTYTLILILMIVATLLLIGVATLVLTRPGAPLAGLLKPNASGAGLRIFVQTPLAADIDQDFTMLVTVLNDGQEVAQIDELRLPQTLLQAATVMGIFPSSPNPRVEAKYTAYPIGMLLAPQERLDIEVTLRPKALAEVLVEIQIVAGERVATSGVRLVFADLFSSTDIPPTQPSTPTALPTFTILPPTPTITPVPVQPYQAVVRLLSKMNVNGKLRDFGSGSGVLISTDGYILTNAHLATPPNRFYTIDAIAVFLTLQPDQPPVLSYYAELVQVSQDLDIAVLRIIHDAMGVRVDSPNLRLPFVPLGNSDNLQLGDSLLILGYPQIGGETITLTNGEVAGFSGEEGHGDRAWIKTSGAIMAGTSGGLVVDRNGFMVAIPTQIGSGERGEAVDCRILVDTNGDGDIDDKDTCVSVGGFINALRPINLALPLIQAAMGVGLPTPTVELPTPTITITGGGPTIQQTATATP